MAVFLPVVKQKEMPGAKGVSSSATSISHTSTAGCFGRKACCALLEDVAAFESHLQQLYLYYKARRRRGQAVVVVSLAWACYNVSVWIQGWVAAGEISWFLLLNTVGSVALASVCVRSTYRDSQVYVPHRYETGCNSILRLLGLSFEGGKSAGDALKRRHISMAKSGEGSGTTSTRTSWKTGSR